jgi:ATP-dependent Clp protease ATP-binding subunit ClpC
MEQIYQILEIQLEELRQRLRERGWDLAVTPEAKRILAEKGWDPKYGGRPLRRAIQRELEDPLSRLILLEDAGTGAGFLAESDGGRVVLRRIDRQKLSEQTEQAAVTLRA